MKGYNSFFTPVAGGRMLIGERSKGRNRTAARTDPYGGAYKKKLKLKSKRISYATPGPGQKKGRSSRATGIRGVYRGKIKGLRKGAKKNKFARDGYEFIKESNSSWSNNHCVYVGHGTAAASAYKALWGAAFRSLLHKCGIEFVNWYDPIVTYGGTPRIIIHYSADEQSVEQSIDLALDLSSFSNALDQIVTAAAAVQLAIPMKTVVWRNMISFSDSFSMMNAKIDLTYYNVEFKMYSKMKIQNRTSARKDVDEADGDDDSADNVEAVPLTGKIYEQLEWKNGFSTRNSRSTTPAVHRGSLSADGIGVIELSADSLDDANVTNSFRKPPPAYFMGNKIKVKTVKLDPGAVKDTQFVFKAYGGFNTMCRKFDQGTANQLLTEFGKAQVFSLEKEVTIGSEDSTPIRVGFQIDQKYQCVGYSKRALANPVTNIPH